MGVANPGPGNYNLHIGKHNPSWKYQNSYLGLAKLPEMNKKYIKTLVQANTTSLVPNLDQK